MMNRSLRIFTDIDNRDVELSVSPAPESKCPAKNILKPDRSLVMRVIGQEFVLIGKYPSTRQISGAAFMRHNMSSSASWRFELFADDDLEELVYDSGELNVIPVKALGELILGVDPLGANIYSNWVVKHGSFMLPKAVFASAWRLTVQDPVAEYIDIGRAIVGHAFTPFRNASKGLTMRWHDPSKQYRTDGGSLRTDSREPYRVVEFDLESLTKSETRFLFELQRRIGLREDVFISIYPSELSAQDVRDGEIHCKFTDNNSFVHKLSNLYSKSISLEEV